jgi:hypothetical protein
MNGRDLKLNQRLEDACSDLSSYRGGSELIEPVEYSAHLKEFEQL